MHANSYKDLKRLDQEPVFSISQEIQTPTVTLCNVTCYGTWSAFAILKEKCLQKWECRMSSSDDLGRQHCKSDKENVHLSIVHYHFVPIQPDINWSAVTQWLLISAVQGDSWAQWILKQHIQGLPLYCTRFRCYFLSIFHWLRYPRGRLWENS